MFGGCGKNEMIYLFPSNLQLINLNEIYTSNDEKLFGEKMYRSKIILCIFVSSLYVYSKHYRRLRTFNRIK